MPYREGKKWRGCVVKDGKRHTSLVHTKKEAKEWEHIKRKEFQAIDKRPLKVDCLTLCAKYLDYASRFAEKTRKEKEVLCVRVLKLWGEDIPIEEISSGMVLEYLSEQGRLRTNNESNKDRKNLMAMFNFARMFMDLKLNPVLLIKELPHDRRLQYTPPEKDILKILMVTTREERVFLMSYLQTGARRSEIFHWKWLEDINFDKREVRLGTRKTKDGSIEYAWLPMSDDLYENLLWWWQNHPMKDNQYVFYVTNPKSRYHGDPYKGRRQFLEKLCERAKVKPFSYHSLRRYVASMLADTYKISAKTIQRILRHKNVTTTERYIQNINHDLKGTMNLLGSERSEKIHEDNTRNEKRVNPI